MVEPDLATWRNLLVRQLAGQAGPAWGIYNIYTVGKLGSAPTKVETNSKLNGDYTDENRGKHVKCASNCYATKPHY